VGELRENGSKEDVVRGGGALTIAKELDLQGLERGWEDCHPRGEGAGLGGAAMEHLYKEMGEKVYGDMGEGET